MGARLMTWMGDGTAVEMTRDELRADVEDGIAISVKRAKVSPLDDGEVAHPIDIFASQERMTGGRVRRREPASNAPALAGSSKRRDGIPRSP